MVAGGGVVGLLFGIFAERTDFCSRAAFARLLGGTWRQDGTSLLYLLLAMLAAITGVQGLALTDAVDFSISGERDLRFGGIVVGGLLFGIGMALSRGCISRLLVLTGRGQQPGADYARLSRSCRLVIDQWCFVRAARCIGGVATAAL